MDGKHVCSQEHISLWQNDNDDNDDKDDEEGKDDDDKDDEEGKMKMTVTKISNEEGKDDDDSLLEVRQPYPDIGL